ncbi:MAG: rhomboid family intramembrane serine protease [Mangrovicoccus sp.]
MKTKTQSSAAKSLRRYAVNSPGQSVLLWLMVLCIGIETALTAADLGLWGTSYWRGLAYDYAAYHATLLHGLPGNYPGQALLMHLSYSFLHGGMLHMGLNMIALASFGAAIVARVGPKRFLLAYFLTAIVGGLFFGILSKGPSPMVGASGALFGLVGVWICWDYLDRRHYGEGLGSIYRAVAYLAFYNVAFWFLLSGHLAWETHLGGFVAGWLLALYWGRPVYRRRNLTRSDP